MTDNRYLSTTHINSFNKGFTKIEVAAIAAMQGMLASGEGFTPKRAIKQAHKLFDELERK